MALAPEHRKLWASLYDSSEGTGRLEAAQELLAAADDDPVPVWLFEWLANGGLVSGKKSALPEGGLGLLVSLLARVPTSYPLGPQAPWLFAQLRAAAGSSTEAPLMEELLRRPPLSFRPMPEQAMPIFQEAASRYAKGASEHPGDFSPVASAASLLRRSLAGAAAKKAFRSALDALPSMAGILAAGAAHADLEASLTELLGILAAPEQLPGLEVLAASWERGEAPQALDSETPPKKRRKEGDVGVYQAQLFTDLRRLLAEDVALFAPLLPRLLEAFVLGLQRQRVQEQHRREWQRKAEGVDDKAVGVQHTPREFLIFDQFWKALKAQLRGATPPQALQSFLDLWRAVRRHNLYRPREDPAGCQNKALEGSVALLLKRLRQGATEEELTWACLEELLALDVAPFESRLPALWAAALPRREGAAFGAGLVRSYAAMADLPSCLEALVQSLLQQGEGCKADLVDCPTFLEGLQEAASQLTTPQQLRGAWELLLKHLPEDQEAPASWVPTLLSRLASGLRPSELLLEPLRELFLQTFSRLEGWDPVPLCLQGLLLALCGLGRKISAYDLPPLLRQHGAPVATKTLKGLQLLAAAAVEDTEATEATEEQAQATSVLLYALQDQQHAARKKRRKYSVPEVAKALLQLKAQRGGLELLAPTVAAALAAEGDALGTLASFMTPQDRVVWCELAACPRSGEAFPSSLAWCRDGEALLEAAPLRAPLLRGLAERLKDALQDAQGDEERKPKKRKRQAASGQLQMLQGVLTALHAARTVPLRDLPTDVTVQLIDGHLAAVRAAVGGSAELRSLSLRCFSDLLHRLAMLRGTKSAALDEAVVRVVQHGTVLTDLAAGRGEDEASVASALAAALAGLLRLWPLGKGLDAGARRRLAATTVAAVAGDAADLVEAGPRAVVALPPPALLMKGRGSLPKRMRLLEAFLGEPTLHASLDRSIEITISEDAKCAEGEPEPELALALLGEEVSRLTRLGPRAADGATKRRVILDALRQVLELDLSGDSRAPLRGAAGRLLRLLCASFGQADDGELWDRTAALLLSWTERVAAQVPLAASSDGAEEGVESYTALAKAPGASAKDLLSRICVRIASRPAGEASGLTSLGSAAAALLTGMPRAPALDDDTISASAAAARRLLHAAEEPDAPDECSAALLLAAAKVTRALYVHLASPLMAAGRHRRMPHRHLADVEGQLVETAACVARAALARGHTKDAATARDSSFMALQSAANALLKAMFAAVPTEGVRLPAWTERPHLLAEALRPMLEAVYAAPNGTAAVQAASDITRLWEVLGQGGTRSTAASAGRSGHTTFQARVQRATTGSALPLIAHALSCERHFPGVEVAARRHGSARDQEAVKWKEAVSIVKEGISSLLNSVKGAENLLQGLYATLREPLRSMFKELHQTWQKHRYQGEA